MKHLKIFLLSVLSFTFLIGQGKRDYIWQHGGNRSPTNDTTYWRFQIDFNTKPKSLYVTFRDPPLSQNNASICDKEGNFLMYTSGCWVTDRLHRKMPNGIINEGAGHDFSCEYGNYSIANGTLILPASNSENNYWVVHKLWDFVQDSLTITAATKLLYSMVDLRLNNGYGDLVIKNQILIDKYLSASDLTGVRHSNSIDWWVLSPGRANNKYYLVQMTEQGPLPYKEQSIGLPFYFLDDGGSQSCFSPDGTKYARMTPSNGLFLMDFDRSDGTLSNFRNVVTGSETNDHTVGVAFSPDSRFVYLSYRWDLYQVDTWEPNVQGSLVHIDTWDGYVEGGIWAAGFDAAMLGPDCKIYIRTGTSNKVMHVIHDPNKKGKDCNFQQHGIALPARNHASIPNFVNYRLGYEPACDSNLVMTFSFDPADAKYDVVIYPNPVKDEMNVEYLQPNNSIRQLYILDATGKIVTKQLYNDHTQTRKLKTKDLLPGIYHVKLVMEDGNMIIKKVIK